MNLDTHNRYFRDIAFNQIKDTYWSETAYIQGISELYEARIKDLINGCHHAGTLQEMITTGIGKVNCLWINVNPEPLSNGFQEFEQIGRFFGIWHEHKRGVHKGVHEFYWRGRYVLLLNIFEGGGRRSGRPLGMKGNNYKSLMPLGTKVLARSEF